MSLDRKPESMAYKTPDGAVLDQESVFDAQDLKEKESQLNEGAIQDANPFGDETCAEVKFRTMSWWQCGMLMIAENISLGVLSLPSAVAQLGLAPAIVIILGLSGIAWYTGYIVGQFKLQYPQVHSMADAGEILLGRLGREVLEIGQLLFLVFLMASHVLTFTEAMNTITDHGTCTIVFSIVSLIICVIATIPRTMNKVYWMCIASFISIFAAILITMIAIGVQSDGVKAEATTQISFYKAFLAVTNIVFAYIAHVAFFGFISEMKEPKQFPRSLAMLQVTDTSMYLVTAVVSYCYFGPDIASPALGSAGPIMKKVAYGIALPTILIAGVVFGHVSSKYIYVRIFRGTDKMHKRTPLSVGVWLGIDVLMWTIAWIIAESIPVFNNLLSLVSSIFGSWFSYGLPAIFWLYLNKQKYFSSPLKILLTIVNLIILGIAFAICGLGLYVSGRAIHEDTGGGSWTCADNSS